MKRISVTIIGVGPRGLSVLERIAAMAGQHQLLLDVALVEPGECGPGVHGARQPQHLLINTIASQVTVFPADGMVQPAPVCATSSLTQWARDSGYRRVGDAYYRLGQGGAGHEISELDYLPRCLLGAYLGWAYGRIAAAMPRNVTLSHHRLRACDLWQQPDGRSVIELDNGFILLSDFVFLTTGHGRNLPSDHDACCARFAQDHARYNSKLGYVRHIYPLEQLVRVGADARVAIQGLGLSAHDVIAELTVGRGGVFVDAADGLTYRPSGREPKLLLFSRNCLPSAARGVNQKGLSGRHRPHYFTPAAIEALRLSALARRGSRQLDFDAELLPLLLREMGYVYRATRDGAAPDPATYTVSEEEGAVLDGLLFPLRGRQFASLAAFRAFVVDSLRADLREARLGNVGSAVKAATDVLRDVRASLQAALEHGGLTPASHRRFLKVYHAAINRVSFGPPRRRNEELLALLDAGIVDIAAGPNSGIVIDENASTFLLQSKFGAGQHSVPFDVLLIARLDAFHPETDDAPLTRKLMRRGLVRPYYNGMFHPGGIDIDAAGHPLRADGSPIATLWALGYLVEGVHYYTYALPRPQLPSRQVLDAQRCVGAMFAAIASADEPRRPDSAPVTAPATPAERRFVSD